MMILNVNSIKIKIRMFNKFKNNESISTKSVKKVCEISLMNLEMNRKIWQKFPKSQVEERKADVAIILKTNTRDPGIIQSNRWFR